MRIAANESLVTRIRFDQLSFGCHARPNCPWSSPDKHSGRHANGQLGIVDRHTGRRCVGSIGGGYSSTMPNVRALPSSIPVDGLASDRLNFGSDQAPGIRRTGTKRFRYVNDLTGRPASRPMSSASTRWRFRRRGRRYGSLPIRGAICRPPAVMPEAASSTAITMRSRRAGRRTSSPISSRSGSGSVRCVAVSLAIWHATTWDMTVSSRP